MLSFIVPAYNEEVWLGRCLDAIRAAAGAVGEAYEVIVVDDASTDETPSIAARHGARVIHVEHRQISATRNAGAKEAKGDVLFFVDADTLMSEAIVRSALRAVSEGAVGGGCVPHFEGVLPLWFRLVNPVMVFVVRRVLRQTGGACVFCTRRAWDAVGGFSEAHYAAEEDVWVKALKRHGKFVVLDAMVTTSGRNLRSQSLGHLLRLLLRLALHGADDFRGREGLDIWYRPRREETQK